MFIAAIVVKVNLPIIFLDMHFDGIRIVWKEIHKTFLTDMSTIHLFYILGALTGVKLC
jgi:hypothetical protein